MSIIKRGEISEQAKIQVVSEAPAVLALSERIKKLVALTEDVTIKKEIEETALAVESMEKELKSLKSTK